MDLWDQVILDPTVGIQIVDKAIQRPDRISNGLYLKETRCSLVLQLGGSRFEFGTMRKAIQIPDTKDSPVFKWLKVVMVNTMGLVCPYEELTFQC